MPDFKDNFYYGLKGSSVTEDGLKQSFSKDMIVLIGTKDFVTKVRPSSYEEVTESYDRLWRAQFFCEKAKATAEQMGAEFKWIYKTVPGANHNDSKHAKWGSRYAARSAKNISRKNSP